MSLLREKKIGVIPSLFDEEGLSLEVREKVRASADALVAQGAELIDIELPHMAAAMSAYYVIGPCEAFSNLSRFDSVRYGYCHPNSADLNEQQSMSRALGFGDEVLRRIMLGAYLLSSEAYEVYYHPAQRVRTLITQDFERAFEQVDTILLPTSPRTAFGFGEITDPTAMYLSDMYTVSINIAGNCGINVPVGLGSETNLPVGAQLIGKQFGDAELITFASALERAMGVMPSPHDARAQEGRCAR